MRNSLLILLFLIMCPGICSGQSHFFRQYWMEYNSSVNNTNSTGRPERPRVGDRGMSSHPDYWSRTEAQVNGLVMINIPDTIKNFDHAELCLEIWGGHPGTTKKRFQINGGQVYFIPDQPTAEGNCEYHYPTIPVDYRDLVKGNNAIQFGCDRGTAFWGHYIIDQMAIRCYITNNDYAFITGDMDEFTAIPSIKSRILGDRVNVTLSYPLEFTRDIAAVHFFARYTGYDNNGSGKPDGWKGYTHDRKYTGHLGSDDTEPFSVVWNTEMIPDQNGPMALRALIEFRNGLLCWSDVLDGLTFPPKRQQVQIFYCPVIPRPFWSRNNNLIEAAFEIPENVSDIEKAELHVRIWDGGEGSIRDPFSLNGVPYAITTGKALHDLVYTISKVEPESLVEGLNTIRLISDTEHHGIEVCWPGPALVLKYK